MSSFSVIMLYVWSIILRFQNLEHKADRKPLQRSGDINSTEGLRFSHLAHLSSRRLPGFFAVTLLFLKWLSTDFVHCFRLPSFSLISRWKKYPVPHKVSSRHQTSFLRLRVLSPQSELKCPRLCCSSFTAAVLFSASQAVAGSFSLSFLLRLSLVLF